jgi:hypothetical protein
VSVNDFKIELNLAFARCELDQADRRSAAPPIPHCGESSAAIRECPGAMPARFQLQGGREHRRKRCPQFVAEHGEKLIFRQIGARFFLQFLVGFLQFFLTFLQLGREGLRLLEQIFRPRVASIVLSTMPILSVS